jgi:hypothetical protein
MASYSTDANVQNLVYGTTNSDLDTATTNARDVATSIINAHLNLDADIASPSNLVTRTCTLIAAGILSTGPDETLEQNGYYKMGMLLLESIKGDVATDAPWGITIPTDRFT